MTLGSRRARWVLVGCAATAAGLVSALALVQPVSRGFALYHGYLPLAGRIAGHAADLPPGTATCAACHDAPRPAAGGYKSIPPLDGATLTSAVSRRSGPASTYDAASFCALLGSGLDPAMIMVDRTMPRFTLSPADCAALWSYVSRR